MTQLNINRWVIIELLKIGLDTESEQWALVSLCFFGESHIIKLFYKVTIDKNRPSEVYNY